MIVGQGAISALLVHILRSSSQTHVELCSIGRKKVALSPKDTKTAWRFQIGSYAGEEHCYEVPEISEEALSQVALVFICVKSFDLRDALSRLTLISQSTPVISLCNGAVWPTLREWSEVTKRFACRSGFTNFGVTRLAEPNRYKIASSTGEVIFGPMDDPAGSHSMTLVEANLCQNSSELRWREDASILQRIKWIQNTTLNTICAAKRLPANGDAMKNLILLRGVFDEVYLYQNAAWGRLPAVYSEERVFSLLLELIQATRQNENSMMRDLRLGRKKETEFLSGLLASDPERYPMTYKLHHMLESNA